MMLHLRSRGDEKGVEGYGVFSESLRAVSVGGCRSDGLLRFLCRNESTADRMVLIVEPSLKKIYSIIANKINETMFLGKTT
jgi:hypothetical protein